MPNESCDADGNKVNAARNVASGILCGYGSVSFLCFFVLQSIWTSTAPAQPNEALGLIYLHNEHGAYTYFSAFQATACWLLFTTSVPLAMIGALTAPKKNIKGTARWFGARYTWDPDDPRSLMKLSAIASALATPFLIYFVGPQLIHALNAAGFAKQF